MITLTNRNLFLLFNLDLSTNCRRYFTPVSQPSRYSERNFIKKLRCAMNNTLWLSIAAIGLTSQAMAEPNSANGSTIIEVEDPQHHLQQTISDAISRFEQTSRNDWSYRITRYENEEGDVTSSIETFNPANESGKRWSLLRINGQEPTEKQAKKFVKSKQKKSKKGNEHNFSVKLRDIIQLDSLELLSEDQNTIQASFEVYLSQLGEDATEDLKGKLTYGKDQAFIESIEITNTDVFSPVFSAEITEFKLTFRFLNIGEAVLPDRQDLSMKGTFAFFTEIDEVSTDTFSEYQYMGE